MPTARLRQRPTTHRPSARLLPALAAAALAATAAADSDWNNFGGNAQRNGQSSEAGPTAADLLWSTTAQPSIISWQPVTLDSRVFVIREIGFPSLGGSAAVDPIYCYDLDTGAFLWSAQVPYAGDPDEEWIAYVGGANDGKVYAARGGSGRTTPVYAFDAITGSLLWTSEDETVAGPQDGIVFDEATGDLLVGDFDSVLRIDATDGTTVWETTRSCPVSGNCGVALGDNAVYFDEAGPGGNVITKLDLATGAELYSSPVMVGFTAQNAPFVSPDKTTVYYARSQNNVATDFLYAFEDTGTAFVEKWNRAVRWTTSHEHGIGPDGSIYTFLPGNEFARLHPDDGSIINTAGELSPIGVNLSARTVVDRNGNVYVSNGYASSPLGDGRIWAFSQDLSTTLFTLTFQRQNSGGPSLGQDGTLVVADLGLVAAYRSEPPCAPDLTGEGDVNTNDFFLFLSLYQAMDPRADFATGGGINTNDFFAFLAAYQAGC